MEESKRITKKEARQYAKVDRYSPEICINLKNGTTLYRCAVISSRVKKKEMIVKREDGSTYKSQIPYEITVMVRDFGENKEQKIDLNDIIEFDGDKWLE
jgi:GTPase Era involved in 16S rRNA processing